MRTRDLALAFGSAGLLIAATLPSAWKADLSAKGGSGVTGTATLDSKGASPMDTSSAASSMSQSALQATITVSGAEAGSTLDWAINDGKCDAGGSALGSSQSFPQITVDQGGSGTATANVSASLDPSKDYSASVKNGGSVVACGDFSNSGQ